MKEKSTQETPRFYKDKKKHLYLVHMKEKSVLEQVLIWNVDTEQECVCV